MKKCIEIKYLDFLKNKDEYFCELLKGYDEFKITILDVNVNIAILECKIENDYYCNKKYVLNIKQMHVIREYTRKKIGTKFLQIIIEICKINGYKYVYSEVENNNYAFQNFLYYEGFGKIKQNTFIYVI